MERAGAVLGEFRLQALADRLVRAGKVEFAERGPDVEAGAADEDRDLAALLQVGEHGVDEVLVLRDARGLGDVPDVEQMVRDAPALGLRELGGADVHARIQLHGVGVDDLAVEFQRQVHGQVRLARGGRAYDGDQHVRTLVNCAGPACRAGPAPACRTGPEGPARRRRADGLPRRRLRGCGGR